MKSLYLASVFNSIARKASAKLLFAACSLLLCTAAFAQPVPELLYYRFDEVGASVTNMASNPPTGTATATIMGSVTQGSSGQCGGALVGSGVASTTDYLNTGFVTSLSGPWTISVWTSNFNSMASLYYIFGDLNAGSFRCFTNGVAGPNNWVLRGTGITDVYINGGATAAPHVSTFVYDDVAGNITGYLDGVLVTTVAQAGPITVSGPGPFKVMGYSSNIGAPAGGLLDEFRMYNRALSASEVMEIYTHSITNTVSVTACDTYTVPSGDETYTSGGTYMDTIPRAYCGDSILMINLTINNSTSSVLTLSACDSYTSPSGNYVWSSSGTYNDTIPNSIGCDSVMTITVTINSSTISSSSVMACNSYTSPSGKYTWNANGTYNDTLFNSVGCDSVITLQVTISPCAGAPVPEMLYYRFDGTGTSVPNMATSPPVGTATATIMGSVTQGSNGQCGGALIGSGVTSTTDYLNTGFTTALNGSWSISFWTSNIGPSATLYYIFGDLNAGSFRCFTNGVAGANNWVLRGNSITDVYLNGAATVAPHVSTFVYDAIAGNIKAYLDGVLVNTVVQAGPVIISGSGPFKVMGYSTNVGAPAGGLLDEFRMYNRALTASEVAELYLRTIVSTVSVTACDSYTIPSGNGTYTSSGTYMDTIPSSYCEDSVLTINLTINNSSSSVQSVSGCGSYISPSGNYTWTSDGTYQDTIPNSMNCDSIMTFNVTITTIYTSVTINGNTMTSNTAGASYQWIDCSDSSLIGGATNRSYTATATGDYLVIITLNGCIDTSACIHLIVTGINEVTANGNLTVYPNPNTGTFIIQSAREGLYSIVNEFGQAIRAVELSSTNKYTVEIENLSSGFYFITGQFNGQTIRQKIVVIK